MLFNTQNYKKLPRFLDTLGQVPKLHLTKKMQLIFAVGLLKNRRDERRQGKEKVKTQQQKKKKMLIHNRKSYFILRTPC